VTEERQRIAIAEWDGWTWEDRFNPRKQQNFLWSPKKDKRVVVWKDGEHGGDNLPDYLNDLNAMRDVVAKLPEDLYDLFEIGLSNLVSGMQFDTYSHWSEVGGHGILKATAAQWSESFLRTIGKWESP
jgi:hypothetical protein